MADPCLENTNTVHLSTNTSGDLLADVQLEPLNEGSLEADSNGIGVTLNGSGGIQHTSAGMGLKATGNNVSLDTNGYRVTNNGVQAGRTAGDDTEDGLVITVTRGAVAVGHGPFGINIQNSGPGVTYYDVASNYEGSFSTTFSEFEPSNLFDQVRVYLQRNFDNTGWINLTWQELTANRLSHSFKLNYHEIVGIGEQAVHSYQTRLVYRGGSLSGTTNQGRLISIWKWYIQCRW